MLRLLEALRAVRPGYWVAAGGALLLAALVGRRNGNGASADGPAFAYPSFLTGRRLTNAPVADDKIVHADPHALAAEAGTDVETYTLARVLASETSGGPLEKGAIAWAVRNARGIMDKSILALGTTASGYYGRQARVGFVATSKDPTDRDLYVATMVLASAWPDPTGGAHQWIHTGDMDALFARGDASFDAAGLIARRRREGKEPVVVAGTGDLVLFRRVA